MKIRHFLISVLVTHEHDDHNKINLVTQKRGCTVITVNEAQDAEKAAEYAEVIGAKHNIPIHTGPFDRWGIPELLNKEIAECFDVQTG